MAEMSVQEMAAKLLSEGFSRPGPATGTVSDPIADTPMVVTLDELRPYELDPRLTRNPLYDEIKASIRERGLDAPPPITRRPGAGHYIIRNGGNTRLAILRELWTETREERFYRIPCLFRPWPERGEIIALTGHLAENELHGGLTFIERALGVAKARELYEAEAGKPLSQSELARRLKADGYPVPQPHISRMQEAIQYLLPAIPNVLYAGLGRHQVEQLTALRRAGQNVWDGRSGGGPPGIEFPTLFQDVLATFDGNPGGFSVQRVQDELIGQMADLLGVNYDTLALEIADSEKRWQTLGSEPASAAPATSPLPPLAVPAAPPAAPAPMSVAPVPRETQRKDAPSPAPPTSGAPADKDAGADNPDDARDDLLREHIVTPAETPERPQSIQRLVADHTGEEDAPDFARNVVHAIPVQAGGLYPISDVWYIVPTLDDPGRLRLHIGQLAVEIASEAHFDPGAIMPSEEGIGFECRSEGADSGLTQELVPRTLLALLQALSAPSRLNDREPISDLGALLLGRGQAETVVHLQMSRLSDAGLVKLFRLIRLARRLLELEAGEAGDDGPPSEA